MKRFKLTKLAKAILFILIVLAVGAGVLFGMKTGLIKSKPDKNESSTVKTSVESEKKKTEKSKDEDSNINKTDSIDNTIRLSLDEWIGWKSIIDANGGLSTQPGSIYDDLGIKVEINVINDATQSSNALIKGNLNAAGYTINRTAFLSKKFSDSGIDVVMPFVTNYSNGGDGIIATNDFQTVESLVNARIGVPQFSEAHSLVVWFVNQSDLSDDQKNKIINNLIFFETPDEAAKAFFAGQIDVAATWQPYLTQASNTSDCHILFSTASSSKLILDGILFRDDFASENPEVIKKFIDGALKAIDLYDNQFSSIREVMPMFAGMSDDEIIAMTKDAALANWKNNKEILNDEAPYIFGDMCAVWKSVGEDVNENLVSKLFNDTYINMLSDEYEFVAVQEKKETLKVTNDNSQEILDATALLTKSASVNFIINTAKFTDNADAASKLDEFIKVAKLLDGTIIQIEGNTDPNPNSDPQDIANKMLSQQRAETVRQYFIMNGISADRIIAVGNGSSKPMVENDTEEHKAMNRRTDVSFKCIE